jgi:3-hydroxyacyl-[acyl-carrier-protein] dehydratase
MRFLLVDCITELESGKRASGVKNVTLSEDFFTFHFPNFPVMPGALIIECLVQLADWLLREHTDFEFLGIPESFDSVKFYSLVRPGDRLLLDVEIVGGQHEVHMVKGTARCEGRTVAVGRFTMTVKRASEYYTVEEARRLYKMLRVSERQE